MRHLSLALPGFGKVTTPDNVPSGAAAPGVIISASISLVVAVGVMVALGFVIYGGILWVTSQGDKAKLDHARRAITYAIVGLIVMFLAFVIVQAVGLLIGVSFLDYFKKA